MFDFALSFYHEYTLIFYILLTITVILEGPITILLLGLLSQKFGFSFLFIYSFAIIGEFCGDILHYVVGRFFKNSFFKNKNFVLFEKTEEKLKKHSLFDKLIVIKYTPPITSIGLLYLGFQKVKFQKFIKNIFIFSVVNGLVVTFIGFHFGKFFGNDTNFTYIIAGIFFCFLLVYIFIRFVGKTITKYIFNK